MIIYGSRNKEVAREHIVEKCPHCGTMNSIDMHVFQKYAHVFWIPFFPMGKTGISQCDHCRQVLNPKEMPASLRAAYDNLKAGSRTPIWTFSGLGLIVLLVAFAIVQDKKKNEKNAKLIAAPIAGDIFKIKTTDRKYTLYKVDEVSADSVFILINNYEVNKLSGLHELESKSYSPDIYGFSKKELKTMLESGEILDIQRK